ncbi:MAG: hypothetical protein JWM53_3349 [bacterium]|nr:hypothetical protein [bacterium]
MTRFDNSGEIPMNIPHPNTAPDAPAEGYGDVVGKRAERINERTPGGAGKTDPAGPGNGYTDETKRRLEEQGRTDSAAQRRGVRPRR